MSNYSTPTHVNAPLDTSTTQDASKDNTATRSLIGELVGTAEDGARGFETAADLIDDPTIAATFRKLGAKRKQIATELRAYANARFGEFLPAEGTIKGALHRGWMRLKDMVAGTDPNAVIAAAEEGEDHALQRWTDALEQKLPDDLEPRIRHQYIQIKESHDDVRALEVATK